MKLGDISVNYVDLMRRAAGDRQEEVSRLMASYNISEELLATPKARISIPRFMRLGHAIIDHLKMPELGLEMGRHIAISHLGLAGYAGMTAENLRGALQLWVHYERLSSENKRGTSRFLQEGKLGIAQFYSISPYNEYNYFVVDCILAGWYQLACWITRATSLLKEVQIEFPAPPYREHYETLFACPVRFGQRRNALIFNEEALSRPSAYAHIASHQEAVDLCNRELSAITGGQPFRERVRQIITPMLQQRDIELGEVARQLGLTPWSLQRRLQAEDTKFTDVVSLTRQSIAARYLTATDLSIGEISFLLGFSSPAAFHRAFKRWFGINPKPFRDRNKSGDSDISAATE